MEEEIGTLKKNLISSEEAYKKAVIDNDVQLKTMIERFDSF